MIPWLAWAALLLALPGWTRWLCGRLGLEKRNFRGDTIPAAAGLTPWLALAAAAGLGLFPGTLADVFFPTVLGFGLLGLADDRWGNRAVGGFRGHLRALRAGRPTTGALKLLGGGALALWAAWRLEGAHLSVLVDGALIALGANAVNLLDLRPGRAAFAFLALGLPALASGPTRPAAVLFVLTVAAWSPTLRADRAGRAMLGDTGANLLGAAAGLACAASLSLAARAALALALLALNLAAERISLTAWIERTPWLRALDRSLGIRE